jgi:hypothetical protein
MLHDANHWIKNYNRPFKWCGMQSAGLVISPVDPSSRGAMMISVLDRRCKRKRKLIGHEKGEEKGPWSLLRLAGRSRRWLKIEDHIHHTVGFVSSTFSFRPGSLSCPALRRRTWCSIRCKRKQKQIRCPMDGCVADPQAPDGPPLNDELRSIGNILCGTARSRTRKLKFWSEGFLDLQFDRFQFARSLVTEKAVLSPGSSSAKWFQYSDCQQGSDKAVASKIARTKSLHTSAASPPVIPLQERKSPSLFGYAVGERALAGMAAGQKPGQRGGTGPALRLPAHRRHGPPLVGADSRWSIHGGNRQQQQQS